MKHQYCRLILTVMLLHLGLTFLLPALCVSAQSGLQSGLQGIEAVFPSDGGRYTDASKAYNLRFTYNPAAVAFPTSIDQVSQAVKAANANNMTVVARSGGHSYIANGLGGKNNVLVVDMSQSKSIKIDSSSGVATITTGNRLGDIALALDAQGRGMPHGSCPYVGIGGHAGFGGFGFASRMWGLTLDTIKSINVVLANGTIATASESENSELFWGLRGSSPSFGIVFSMDMQTFVAPSTTTSFTYTFVGDVASSTKVVSSFQNFSKSVSGEMGGELNIGSADQKGQLSISFLGVWYGSNNDFDSTLQPFLGQLPAPSSKNVTPGNYRTSLNYISGDLDTTDAPDVTDTFYAKSMMTFEDQPLTDKAISAYLSYLANEGFTSDTSWFTQVELYGGSKSAINAVPEDSTAFAYRNAHFTLQLYASSSESKPPYPQDGFGFVNGMVNAIVSNQPQGWNYGAYTNYVEDRLENWQQRYYGSHYARLQALKSTLDPKNVFSFPTSIELP